MKQRWLTALVTALTVLFFNLTPVFADGIIIPEPPICPPNQLCPPHPRPMTQLEIKYHHVSVTIQDQVAVTHVDQVFYNPNDWPVEGIYIFPLPLDAAVTNFILWIDGEPVQGEILDAEQARQTYQEIVNQMRDPALLEYIGRGAVQVSIFPISPGGTRRIELEYTQALTAEGGLVRYIYPLNTEKFSASPLESVSVTVRVESSQAVRAVYSPTHAVDVTQPSPNRFSASYEASNVLPDSDFTLYYSLGESQAFHVLSFRDPGDLDDPDGFFLLLLAPQPKIEEQVVAKDLLLVLDRSGSMEGEKFGQAQAALTYILNNLNPEDRFYLSAFSSGVEPFSPRLQPASEARQALGWVDRLSAVGSTDINRALLEAVSVADKERPTYLIFLTDGLPTEGVVNSQQILDNFKRSAPDALRLFAFGVGYDVDTILLDSLAQEHRGLSTYVRPGEALDEILSGFYASISTPVLTNLKVDFGSLAVYDIFPNPLPDMFSGSQIIVTGRYRQGGRVDVSLTGEVNGQAQKFVFDDQVFATNTALESGPLASLPRLWATRKIGHLLNQVRLEGPNKEIIDQIVRLSIRYGIVTPYTSYLVTETLPLGAQERQRIVLDAYQESLAAPTQVYGAEAVEKAAGQGELSRADIAPAMPAEGEQVVRIAGSRTFVRQEQVWVDTAFDSERMTPVKVAFLSDSYFDLASARPDLAAALALGERVIVVVDGSAYEVVASDSQVPALDLPVRPSSTPPAAAMNTPTPGSQGQSDSPASNDNNNNPIIPGFCAGSYLPLAILAAWRILRRRH